MATVLVPTVPPPRQPARFSVADYHKLDELGMLPKVRCELIRGLILEKPKIKPPHATVVRKLNRLLPAAVPAGVVVQCQLPVTLADSEPEPDFAVAVGDDGTYAARHPRPAECLLVVEVADSSLHEDRTDKLELYAESKIAVYWIVNIPDRQVEVYTLPRGGKAPTYRTRSDYAPGQDVPVVLAGQTVGALPVSDLLP